jgi:hypothetical protein
LQLQIFGEVHQVLAGQVHLQAGHVGATACMSNPYRCQKASEDKKRACKKRLISSQSFGSASWAGPGDGVNRRSMHKWRICLLASLIGSPLACN